MLGSIRKFSKSIFAKILLVIIIIPFIFWGMGGVFNSGNTNNVAKINNYSISTQDFINYINNSKINSDIIKENINKNILEDLLGGLISQKLLEIEIEKLKMTISEESLAQKIKLNKNFLDDQAKFSRIKYEKFLLEQNLSAPGFENRLKNNELRKKLFSYVSGGIKSPLFITNKIYNELTSELEIDFINLKDNYKKKDSFSMNEIDLFIQENIDNLKEEYIDFNYLKITPKILIGTEEFNDVFFKKIDEIENKISNGLSFNEIKNELKIKNISKRKFIINSESDKIEKKIYQNRNISKLQILEEDNFYILYQIDKIEKILPNRNDLNFLNKVSKTLYQKNKYEFNQKIISNINNKKFLQSDFEKLSNNNIQNLKINSIKDNKKFTNDSVKLLYSLGINTFTLVADKKNNVYLAKIKNIYTKNLTQDSSDLSNYTNQANIRLRDNMYSSYDYFLNEKYKIEINQKTLDRVKNYFK